MSPEESIQAARVVPLGDGAFTFTVDAAPTPALSAALRELGERLSAEPGVLDTVQSFRTLTVFHDPLADRAGLEEAAAATFSAMPARAVEGRVWTVQGRFDGEAGPDQAEAAEALGLDVEALIDALTGTDWPVLAVGFIAGFPFLGPLPETLKLPRRASPRTRVPAGSIAIANGFCGIYPWVSPGGWHILGHTDFTLFDASANPPARLAPGDRVRFERL
jgi:KipI family sensor histidine kinase inhibitor